MATKRAAKAVSASLDFAFFQFLWQFYQSNRKRPAIPPWLGIGVGCR